MKKFLPVILLILIVSLPNILFVVFGDESTTSTLLKKIGFLFLSGAYIVFPLSFIKPKYYFGILVLFIPFSFLDIFLILVHYNQSTVTHYLSVFGTNPDESFELIGDFKMYFLSFVLLFTSYLYFFKKLIRNDLSITVRNRKTIFTISFLVIIVIGARDVRNAIKYYDDDFANLSLSKVSGITKELVSTKIEKSFPLGIVLKISQSLSEYSKLQGLLNGNIRDYQLSESDINVKIDNIILIVGESARKESFGIYGYKRNTTPLLSGQENLLVFNKAVTTSNITITSLIQSLSSVLVGKFDSAYQEKGIYSAFNIAGFNTRIISRQPYQYSSYLNAISRHSNVYKFISGDFGKGDSFDNELLDVLDEGEVKGKDFMVAHTMGSHMRYNLRYPKEFEKYTPSVSDNEGRFTFNTEMKKRLVNAYDNSIIYTDFIISEVIKKLEAKGESSVVLYFSDHGENLYDDSRNIVGHGKNIPTKYSLEIPFIIWYSDEYYESNKTIIDNLESNLDSKFTTEVIFHTLCSLGGFKTNLHNEKYDLTSDKRINYKRFFYTVDKKVISTDSILKVENNIK